MQHHISAIRTPKRRTDSLSEENQRRTPTSDNTHARNQNPYSYASQTSPGTPVSRYDTESPTTPYGVTRTTPDLQPLYLNVSPPYRVNEPVVEDMEIWIERQPEVEQPKEKKKYRVRSFKTLFRFLKVTYRNALGDKSICAAILCTVFLVVLLCIMFFLVGKGTPLDPRTVSQLSHNRTVQTDGLSNSAHTAPPSDIRASVQTVDLNEPLTHTAPVSTTLAPTTPPPVTSTPYPDTTQPPTTTTQPPITTTTTQAPTMIAPSKTALAKRQQNKRGIRKRCPLRTTGPNTASVPELRSFVFSDVVHVNKTRFVDWEYPKDVLSSRIPDFSAATVSRYSLCCSLMLKNVSCGSFAADEIALGPLCANKQDRAMSCVLYEDKLMARLDTSRIQRLLCAGHHSCCSHRHEPVVQATEIQCRFVWK